MISYVPHAVWDSGDVAIAARPADHVGQCAWELNGPLMYTIQRPKEYNDGELESRERHPRSRLDDI